MQTVIKLTQCLVPRYPTYHTPAPLTMSGLYQSSPVLVPGEPLQPFQLEYTLLCPMETAIAPLLGASLSGHLMVPLGQALQLWRHQWLGSSSAPLPSSLSSPWPWPSGLEPASISRCSFSCLHLFRLGSLARGCQPANPSCCSPCLQSSPRSQTYRF